MQIQKIKYEFTEVIGEINNVESVEVEVNIQEANNLVEVIESLRSSIKEEINLASERTFIIARIESLIDKRKAHDGADCLMSIGEIKTILHSVL